MQKSKFSKRTVVAIVAAVGIFLTAGGAYAGYAVLDWFKDPKTIYLQAEMNTLQHALKSENGTQLQKFVEESLNTPVHTAVEVSDLELEIEGVDAEQQKIIDLLKDAKLRFETQYDDETEHSAGKARLALGDEDLLNVEMFLKDTQFGIWLPDFDDKYWVVDLEDSEASSLGGDYLDSLPNRTITYKDLSNAVRMNEDEYKPILSSYGKLIYDRLQPEQFALNKDAVFREGEHEFATRQITVTFSEQQYKDFLTAIVAKLADDEALRSLLYSRYDNVSSLLLDAGYDIETISEKEFSEAWDDAVEEMEDSVADVSLKEDLRMVVDIDRKGVIVARKMTAAWTDEDGVEHNSELETRSWDGQIPGAGLIVTARNVTDDDEEAEIEFAYRSGDKDGARIGEWSLTAESELNGEEEAFELTADYEIDSDGKQGDYRFGLAVTEQGTKERLSGSLRHNLSESEESKSNDFEVELDLGKLSDNGGLQSVSFKLRNETFANATLELPTIHAGNSLDIANMTDADTTRFTSDMTESFQRFVADKGDLLGQFMPDEYAMLAAFGESEPSIKRPDAVEGESVELAPGVRLTKHTIATESPNESIAYPVISGLAHDELEEDINALFKEVSLPQVSESYLEELASYGEPYEYHADYEVKFYRGNILNVVFHNYMYTGGAHGMPDMISLIVNLDTGATYQLSDFFAKDGTYYDVVNELILAQDTEGVLDMFGWFESVADDDGMYLQDDSIVVYFKPYQYASFADGFLEYSLPYSELEQVVRKDGDLWKAVQK
ncbi:DUF3298 and DUF4163 domain-containing protein [Paenibacillus sp. TRM 82003]|nr:DUF3298 and DUF4163 domain-containing protein [Paenibacillus sp. TRM 82003]